MQRSRSGSFSLRYRIAPAAAPEVRSGGGGRLAQFDFAPVETTDGAFRIGVQYLPSQSVALLEVAAAAPPPRAQIIADYVGSAASGSGVSMQRRSSMSASLHGSAAAVAVGGGMEPASSLPIAAGPSASPFCCDFELTVNMRGRHTE